MSAVFLVASSVSSEPNKASPNDQSSSNPKPSTVTFDEHNQYTYAHPQDVKTDTPHGYTTFERPEWGLLAAAIITLIIIGRQTYHTRIAAEATEAAARSAQAQTELARKALIFQFRPVIAVRSIQLDDFVRPTQITIRIVNKGGTDAHILQASVGLKCVNIWDQEPPLTDVGSMRKGEIIHAGEERDIGEIPMNESLMWAVASKAARETPNPPEVTCYGDVNYRDDNGIERTVAFSRAYDWSAKRFIPSGNPEKEYE